MLSGDGKTKHPRASEHRKVYLRSIHVHKELSRTVLKNTFTSIVIRTKIRTKEGDEIVKKSLCFSLFLLNLLVFRACCVVWNEIRRYLLSEGIGVPTRSRSLNYITRRPRKRNRPFFLALALVMWPLSLLNSFAAFGGTFVPLSGSGQREKMQWFPRSAISVVGISDHSTSLYSTSLVSHRVVNHQ